MTFISKLKSQYEKLSSKKYFYPVAALPWVAGVIILFLWALRHGYIGLDTNDDIYMNMLNSGTYGIKDPHNVFNNIILGWIYVILYRLIPGHNWNTLLQLMVILFSYLAFGVWNICRNRLLKGYLTSVIFLWATWETMICRMNFSKTGAIALAVGLIILASTLDSDRWKNPTHHFVRVLSYFMIIGGGLFREDTLLAFLPFVVIIAVYILFTYRKEGLHRLLSVVGVMAALLILWIGNRVAYESDSEWKYYVEYNRARAELLDYSLPTYYSNVEEYGKLGLSENDFWTLKRWRFADDKVFSKEVLEELVALKKANEEPASIGETVEKIFDGMISVGNRFIAFYVIIFLFVTAVATNSRRKSYYLLANFLCFVGEIAMLVLRGRTIERAVFVPVLFAIASILFFQKNEKSQEKNTLVSACLLIFIAVYAYYASRFSKISELFSEKVYDKSKIDSILSYTANNSDNLYVMDGVPESVLLIQSYSPFDDMGKVHYDNLTYMGGWQVPTPTVLNIARPYGNPYNVFEMLATNDSVFWICVGDPQYDEFTVYMMEHYFVDYQVVDVFGEYYVVSFEQPEY